MPKPDFLLSTYIRCTEDALWDALRDPAAQTAYDFLGQSVARNGKTTTWTTPEGMDTLVCTEIEAVPKSRLVTSFQPKWEEGAKPSRVIYLIEALDGYCKLTVEHYDLNHPPEGGTADSWARTLAGLKTYLESGEPAHFGGPELWAEA
jgi:hypothetical protein